MEVVEVLMGPVSYVPFFLSYENLIALTFTQIEQLLRRHLTESLGSINTPNDAKNSGTNTINGHPDRALFSPLTLDGPMSSSVEAASSHHRHTHCLDISRPFGLDDVLDATFLNDDDDEEEGEEYLFNMPKAKSKAGIVQSSAEEDGGVSASITDETLPPPPTSSESDLTTTPNMTSSTPLSLQIPVITTSDADAAADAAAAKNLSRWDVISVGAFRQTQIQGDSVVGHGAAATSATASSGHGRTPASSADFGNAMKSSSPLTMLWRGSSSGGQSQRQGQNQKGGARSTSGSGGPASSLIRRTASGGNIVNGKHAKKRRLMMSGAGEMSLPLVLPSTSSGGVRERTPTPTTTTTTTVTTSASPGQSSTSNNSKTRKEARRERKHKKRKGYPGGVGPHQASSSHHQHSQHPHHTYHQHHHHPNAKSRGVSSMQRLGWGGSGWGNGGGGGGHGYGGGGHGGGGWGVGGGGGGFVPMGL